MVHVTSSLARAHHLDNRSLITAKPKIATATASTSTTNTSTANTNNTGNIDNTGASDFRALFSSYPTTTTTAPAATPAPAPAPTPESVFGANPWVSNPTGRNPDGTFYNYNQLYFASANTAAKVAQMLGGKVVAVNDFTAPGSPFVQQQPNLMVQMPDGRRINAGLVAAFYTHGYPQSYIDGLITQQINGTNN